MRTKSVVGLGATTLALALVHCSANKEPAPGELMLSVQTNMAIPKDVDQIRLETSRYGNQIFGDDYQSATGVVDRSPGRREIVPRHCTWRSRSPQPSDSA
jgi:hypothetical protein